MKEKRPGVWRFVVSTGLDPVTGKYGQDTKTFHGNKRDAIKAHAAFATEVGHQPTDRDWTVKRLLDRWKDGLTVTPAVATDYRRIADRQLEPLHGMKLAKVTTRHIDFLLDDLRKDLGSARVAKVRTVLNLAFERARRWKLVSENPVRDAKRIPQSRSRVTAPQPKAVQKVLANAEGDLRKLLVLLTTTGARLSELLALRYDDIDRERRLLTIKAAVAPSGAEIKFTKEEDFRFLSLTDKVLDELGEGEGYIIGGEAWWHPNTASKRFAAFARSCGADVTSRQFRHLVATELLNAGTDAAIVSRRLGHKRVSTTTDVYGHARAGIDRAAAEKLDDLLG